MTVSPTASPDQLRNIVSAGFERAFFRGGYQAKRELVKEQMAYYDKLQGEMAAGGGE